MAISTGSSRRACVQSSPNVTPLIDVLLVLLIIFMVIAPPQAVGLDAKVPQDSSAAQPEPANDVVLTIAEDRSLAINTKAVRAEELAERLRTVFSRRPSAALFVRGAGALAFEDVASVLDVARGAGARQIALIR